MIFNSYDRGFINGAVLVLSEFKNASIIVHGPMGCYSQFLEATATNQQFVYFTSSAMGEKDIIFGGEKSLRHELTAMKPSEAAKVRFVIDSNASSIISEDIDGMIACLRKELNTNRLIAIRGQLGANHYKGINQALVTLARNFTKENEKHKKSINIIGNIGGSIRWKEDLYSLKKLLKRVGIKTNLIAVDIDSDSVESWSQASLTVKLVSEIGQELAEYLEEKFGVPYLDIDMPIGVYGTVLWLKKIEEQLSVNIEPALVEINEVNHLLKIASKSIYWGAKINALQNMRIGIVSESGIALPLLNFLAGELEIFPRLVGVRTEFKNLNSEFDLSQTKILDNIDRDLIEEEIEKNQIELMLGSSYELDMMNKTNGKWLHICNPNYHIISLKPKAYLGFEGTLNFIEDILGILV